MTLLGVILFVLGLIFGWTWLWVLGIVLFCVGIAAFAGTASEGRRRWW